MFPIKPVRYHYNATTLVAPDRPNLLMYLAMHTCYSENDVTLKQYNKSEAEYSALLVKHLLANERGHYGITEHLWLKFYAPEIGRRVEQLNLAPGGIHIINDHCIHLNLRALLRLLDTPRFDKYMKNTLLKYLTELSPAIYDWYMSKKAHPKQNHY